jgi:putative oxidoreductase
MRFRDSLAVNVSPIAIRLILAATFFYAGYAKVFTSAEYTPEQIAALTPLGSDDDGAERGEPSTEVIEPGEPSTPIPDPERPDPDPQGPADGDTSAVVPSVPSPDEPPYRVIAAQDSGEYENDDEPAPIKRRMLYGLALMLKDCATPNENGAALLPSFLGAGGWPLRLAWLAALTELLGGVFMLLGFLTRLSAAGLICTMLTAMWLTTIGPVVILDAPSSFFILPALGDYMTQSWTMLLTQFSMLGASVAALLSGAGALSADRMLLGHRAARDAKPAPAPKPRPNPAFDDD